MPWSQTSPMRLSLYAPGRPSVTGPNHRMDLSGLDRTAGWSSPEA